MTVFASDGTEVTEPAEPATTADPAPPAAEPDDVVEPEVVAVADALPAVRDDHVHDAEVVNEDEPADDAGEWVHESSWNHDWLEYKGDKLAIRVPHQNALTALFQAGQACTPEFQLKLTQKFVKSHLSQESIERVLERMSDPDDEQYAGVDGVWNDLLKTIVDIGGKRAIKDAEALAAVQNGKAKS
ncbi:hypothetical protein ACRCUN_06305 [Mycobacterium sp. LTG2003]